MILRRMLFYFATDCYLLLLWCPADPLRDVGRDAKRARLDTIDGVRVGVAGVFLPHSAEYCARRSRCIALVARISRSERPPAIRYFMTGFARNSPTPD